METEILLVQAERATVCGYLEAHTSAERARMALRVPVDAGWVRRRSADVGPGGGRPSEENLVNPAVYVQ